jgi:hypothetical protein
MSVDLPVVGRVSVGDAPSAVPATSYIFRECLDQPVDSLVQVESHPDGVTLTVPRAGLFSGNKGLLVFALVWLAFTGAVGAVLLSALAHEGRGTLLPAITLGFFILIGIAMLLTGINMSLRRAVLAVVKDRLMVLQVGPLGTRQHEWACAELQDIRTGPSSMSGSDGPVIELQIQPNGGEPFGMLAGRDEAELRWLATTLRQALGLSNVGTSRE